DRTGPHDEDSRQGSLRVLRRRIAARRWGILHPASLGHQWRVLQIVRRLGANGHRVVHCARALPEGLTALLAQQLRGQPYLCWSHGEEIAYALTSRELTFLMKRVY